LTDVGTGMLLSVAYYIVMDHILSVTMVHKTKSYVLDCVTIRHCV